MLISASEASKQQYSQISKRLIHSRTSRKGYWSLLKLLRNNKKIPCIRPLFHNDKFISSFRDKAELFNIFFAKQCTVINNASTPVTRADIAKIMKNLDPSKGHGHDTISIRMLKLYGDSVLIPLELIFKSCLEIVRFAENGKKANVILVHKKAEKQSLENYCPISLLPICEKYLKTITKCKYKNKNIKIYNKMFEYFIEKDLISHNQSGFKRGDSCINQLLSILQMRFINLLMRAMILEVYFLEYRKPLIRFGTKVSSINL